MGTVIDTFTQADGAASGYTGTLTVASNKASLATGLTGAIIGRRGTLEVSYQQISSTAEVTFGANAAYAGVFGNVLTGAQTGVGLTLDNTKLLSLVSVSAGVVSPSGQSVTLSGLADGPHQLTLVVTPTRSLAAIDGTPRLVWDGNPFNPVGTNFGVLLNRANSASIATIDNIVASDGFAVGSGMIDQFYFFDSE